ncbi:MAG TPA: hypothetical protein VFI31_19930 [Pirellulales bacterium]|nr:hypothetical protein [Pirellulales bacterium]
MDDLPDPSEFPRCQKCGVILLRGFMPGGFVTGLKEKYGWKIGRFDQSVPKREWDAVTTACVCHECPRCKTPLDS